MGTISACIYSDVAPEMNGALCIAKTPPHVTCSGSVQGRYLMPCPKGCMRFTLSALRSPASISKSSPLLLLCTLGASLGL